MKRQQHPLALHPTDEDDGSDVLVVILIHAVVRTFLKTTLIQPLPGVLENVNDKFSTPPAAFGAEF
jgi:hypothetical protein